MSEHEPAWPPPLPRQPPPPESPAVPPPAPAHPPTEPVPRGTNTSAIASVVLGVLGIAFWLPLVGSVLALVLGYKAKGQVERSEGRERGRGLAIAGIVLGWIGLALFLLLGVAFALLLAA